MEMLDECKHTKILEAGKLAAYEGKARSANQYVKKSEQRDAWTHGWNQAVGQLQEEKITC